MVVLAVLLWWGTLLIQDTPVKWDHGKPFTVVVSFLFIIWLVFDRFLWRSWPFIHSCFVKQPDLRGTWRVELESSYLDPETGRPVPVIVCYMGIEQRLSELKMHLMTPESESWSIANHVRPSPNGSGYQVISVYTNKPNIHLRDDRISEMHNGTLVIDTHGSHVRPGTLTAEYWTDRKTVGIMNFTSRSDQVFTRFEDADQHFKTKFDR